MYKNKNPTSSLNTNTYINKLNAWQKRPILTAVKISGAYAVSKASSERPILQITLIILFPTGLVKF